MSANADVLRRSDLIGSRGETTLHQDTLHQDTLHQVAVLRETDSWTPEDFAREQIRGLVQRVFFACGSPPVRQVVFSAAGPNPYVANICDRVGHALALETRAHVAIVSCEPPAGESSQAYVGSSGMKAKSMQLAINLWRVPAFGLRQDGEESRTGPFWLSFLAELRNEFEYAVIHSRAAEVSSEAALLGQLADGIILVLGAHSTRKATARKVKETLQGAQCRILGTVLSERKFPVPEGIYRRL
jgi:hypothetical protein